nr:arginine--tRNA ligase [Clostridia bacterium]
MNCIADKAEQQIKTLVKNAFEKAFEDGALTRAELPAFTVEIPADRANGDLSTNAALVGARTFRTAPAKIAAALCERFDFSGTYVESAASAGPGFINFTLSDSYYVDVVRQVLEQGADYGKSGVGTGKRALVEFVSANPTGPMHIGNARGGALGDSLASLLTAAGFETEREFYINDAGNQIEKFGLSLSIRYLQRFGKEIDMP